MEQKLERLTIYGRVQGVGFRPTVCRLAKELGLSGFVRNFGAAVELVIRGEEERLAELKEKLRKLPKPIAVERVAKESMEPQNYFKLCEKYAIGPQSFLAVASAGEPKEIFAPADIAICKNCLEELEQQGNRRYKYPYTSCAQCGPRYTIMERLPYDRATTTMKNFPLCPSCQQEYSNMAARRGHGETISCPSCGPQLYSLSRTGERLEQLQALELAQKLLEQGEIILVKALGGYNLVCRADSSTAVKTLRALKHRPTKPFAVLCSSLVQIEQLCEVGAQEKAMLVSEIRPIVLLRKKAFAYQALAEGVADNCPELGVFFPPMGIFKLLSSRPLIATSCNYSGQPMLYRDEEALKYFKSTPLIAGFFAYNREILRPADDPVLKVIKTGAGKPKAQLLRRTRGYMPEPIKLNINTSGQVLAVGAEMEPSFCLARQQRFYCAQVSGEMAELNTEESWQATREDWENFLEVKPKVVVGDLHPAYNTTRLGEEIAQSRQLPFVQLQHHHAHALSVIAEHQLQEPVLAVCFDGTGYGANGSIWGGEFLLCQGLEYERVAHLQEVPMLGGDESMKQAWKTALCYLADWENQAGKDLSGVLLQREQDYQLVKAALRQGVNVINNSSVGRVFDAVAALLGLREYNSHQGACPQAVEAKAVQALDSNIEALRLHFTKQEEQDGSLCWSACSLWPALLAVDRQAPLAVAAAALGFHLAVIAMIVATAEQLRKQRGVNTIALVGGCFANRILLEGCLRELEARDFQVFFNEKVPVGDGGIALGQAYYGIMLEKTI